MKGTHCWVIILVPAPGTDSSGMFDQVLDPHFLDLHTHGRISAAGRGCVRLLQTRKSQCRARRRAGPGLKDISMTKVPARPGLRPFKAWKYPSATHVLLALTAGVEKSLTPG